MHTAAAEENVLVVTEYHEDRRKKIRKGVHISGYSSIPRKRGETSIIINDISLSGMNVSVNILLSAFRVGDSIDINFIAESGNEVKVRAIIRSVVTSKKQLCLEFSDFKADARRNINFMVLCN